MTIMLKLILGLSSLASIASAAGIYGQVCDPTPYYDTLTWQYNDACQSIYLFCDPSSSKCNYIGCTNTDYTKGWNTNIRPLPGRCGPGTFCPDNRSKCTATVATNSICEMQRDDECQGNNSICLNGICNVKAVPLEGKCGNDTTQYVSNDAEGDAELQTIVRDNCTDGTYCSVNSICINSKANGASCSQDRECVSNTCTRDGVCVTGPDVFHQIAAWLWGVLGASVFVFILIVLLLLWALQRYQSNKEHAKIGKFFGDNEEFAKYAMLDHDNDNDDGSFYHDDTSGLRPPPSIGHRDSYDPSKQRASMVYLTTPDYAKSSSLSLGHHGSTTKLPLNSGGGGGGGGGGASPRGSGTFTPSARGSGTFTPQGRASGSFPNLANNNHP